MRYIFDTPQMPEIGKIENLQIDNGSEFQGLFQKAAQEIKA